MFKHYFEQIQNIAIWPIISLAIFFGFFLLLILWLYKLDNGYVQKMKNLPLEDDLDSPQGKNKKKFTALIVTFLLPLVSFAQTATTTSWDEDTVMLWILILVVVIAVLVLMVAIYLLSILKLFQTSEHTTEVRAEGWWQRMQKFVDRFNKSVPMDKEADVMLDHNYDGIRELDNHLPPWWTALFYFGIIFGIVYMLVYHVFEAAPLPAELYEQEVAEAKLTSEARLASQMAETGAIDESTITFSDDAAVIGNGNKIFDMQCASCHKDDGGGSIGPNLTDAYWIHGGSVGDIFKTIKYGVPEKGMISWEPLLSPIQMRDVTSYIMSLAGSNPPNAKATQGTLYQESEGVNPSQ